MKFDPTLNLGTVIEALMFAIAAAGALRKFGSLETKVDLMFQWFQEHVMSGEAPEPRRRRVSGD